MRKLTLLLLGLALLLTLPAGTLTADDATSAANRTMTGEYMWQDADLRGDLEAVFTSTGVNQWDVDFHFTFRDRPQTFSGTASGNLQDGQLEGRVYGESRRGQRVWVFRGDFAEGTFEGTHSEIEDGEEVFSGTLTLR